VSGRSWRGLSQTSPYDPGPCRHSMIACRAFSALTRSDQWLRVPTVARPLASANTSCCRSGNAAFRSSNVGKTHDPIHIVIPWVASNAAPLASNVALRLADAAKVLANAGANMCTGSWVSRSCGDPGATIGTTPAKTAWNASQRAAGGDFPRPSPHVSGPFHQNHQKIGRPRIIWRGVRRSLLTRHVVARGDPDAIGGDAAHRYPRRRAPSSAARASTAGSPCSGSARRRRRGRQTSSAAIRVASGRAMPRSA